MILLLAVIVSSTSGFTQAQTDELGVTFDLTYMNKWMSRGAQVWKADGGFFETIDVDLWGTGFGVAVMHRSSTNSGWVNKHRFDYRVYYGDFLFDDEPYKTKYKVAWIYKHYYDSPRNARNVQAWTLNLSWPEILGSTGLVPYYVSYYDYPSGSHYGLVDHWAGWVHCFGLGYDLQVPELPNPLHLTSEIAYTDGLRAAEHDWSYATFGVSTSFELSENMAFVPGIYHQISMEDSVNSRNDITYCKISMKYKF
ncbi:hypothetical protein ACFL1G_03540 [Planctomycetota bacterium]